MAHESIITDRFSKSFHDLTDKNLGFKRQIIEKLKDIRQNPNIGEPKKGKLRGLRGLHITEHFVIVYLIFKNYVVFIELGHHDQAYGSSAIVWDRILEDGRLLYSLQKLDIPITEFVDFVRTLRKHK